MAWFDIHFVQSVLPLGDMTNALRMVGSASASHAGLGNIDKMSRFRSRGEHKIEARSMMIPVGVGSQKTLGVWIENSARLACDQMRVIAWYS